MNAPVEFTDLPIEISRIERSPTNPRETFDDDKMASLVESIKRHGVLQPVLLRPWPTTYAHAAPMPHFELIAGERRWRAAKAAGLTNIPARVRTLSDNEVLEFQIVENLQREDLHPIEEANGYERMMTDYGYTAESLGEKIGKSKAYIYARVKLTALCHEARKAFREGKLNPSTALLVARIPTTALQVRATKEITDPDWRHEIMSVRAAQDHIHNHYMLRLVEAPFSRKDPDLVKKAGSCEACPKRTGNQPSDLFEDVKSVDVCTDPDCHQEKRQAQVKKLAAEAVAKGQTVITGKAAEKMMPYSGNVAGHTLLDATCFAAGSDKKGNYKTYRQVLQEQNIDVVLVEDVKKKVLVPCVPEKQLAIALAAAGVKSSTQKQREESKKNDAKVERERAYRTTVFSKTHDALRLHYENCPCGMPDGDLQLVAGALFDRLGHDVVKKLLGHYVEGKVDMDQQIAFGKSIKSMGGINLWLLLMDMVLIPETFVSEYSLDHKPKTLLAIAESSGLDLAEIKASSAEKQRAKVSPPSKAAQAVKPDARVKTKAAPAEKAVVAKPANALPIWPFPTASKSKDSGQASLAERKPEKGIIEKNEAAPAGPQKPAPAATATPGDDGQLKVGDRVRIKDGIKGPNRHIRKVCGREGVVETVRKGVYAVRLGPGRNGLATDFCADDLKKLPAA